MGIEQRKNRQYYYRKTRVGRRVVSEYIGPVGREVTDAIRILDNAESIRRQLDRIDVQKRAAKEEEIDKQIEKLAEANKQAVSEFLTDSGFHRHRGQWRKKRQKTR
jgi:hypothetical protein